MQSTALTDIEIKEYSSEEDNIRKLVEQTATFHVNDPGAALNTFFNDHTDSEGVVVVDDSLAPVGLVMRNDFFQNLGSMYGRALFLKRSAKLVMNPHPLIVDVSVNIATISTIAMNRPLSKVYDIVIITEDEKLLGVVSIKRFMVELTHKREKEIELLKQQKEILHLANAAEVRHRTQIEEKNSELGERNDSIKNLLDNAGQGFLSFGQDCVISNEYSLECVNIFRGPIGGKNFVDLIRKHLSEETGQMVGQIFQNVFGASQNLQQKVYISLLPNELSIYNKVVRIEYKVTQRTDQKGMMLVLTDITEKKELEQKMAQERSNLRMVVKALAKQSDVNMAIDDFVGFVTQDATAMIREAETPGEALFEIFRVVHTFKGDFAQYGLHNTAAQLHEMEDALSKMIKRETPTDEYELLAVVSAWDVEAILIEDKSIIIASLGRSYFETEERFLISKERLLKIEKLIEEKLGDKEQRDVLPILRSLRKHNVKELLGAYTEYLETLAGRVEKVIEPMHVSGDDILIDKDHYRKFFKSIVHVFRNMIDHGIETPEDRLESGKREVGLIQCKVKFDEDNTRFRISISDDGAGIDAAKVKTKAVEKGFIEAEEAERMETDKVYALLFMDSFSTKSDVTSLSGRGMGLAAVKAELEALGGSMEMSSKPGQGTRFTFHIPLQEM
ncbi:ATP-binding protein [Desulfomicrobium sp. ZS1]|uniref:ATP-binding protein n=1 Tax=Desulfomicrobium sp. ZS1 TaxID=2952228 RepID=UPI0020B4391C|nr:ATP-binding protein [Desulfomicrobium sp. ZS1]UTF51847.1 ATP-binding protein [Desulfomicrobium sp. ZS1]